MERKKVAYYGSAFNPVTNAHLATINTIVEKRRFDFGLLSPSSTARGDKTITCSNEHRLEMLKLAVQSNPKLRITTIEYDMLPHMQYTYNVMKLLKEVYPDTDFTIVIGADNLDVLSTWHYAEDLIREHDFVVMNRKGYDMLETIATDPLLSKYDDGRFHLMYKGSEMDISSSLIRGYAANGTIAMARYLLPDACYEYMVKHKLYQ